VSDTTIVSTPRTGKVTTDIGSFSSDTGDSVAIQTDGKILVAGWSVGAGITVVRYNVDGSLDTGFAVNGKFSTDIGGVARSVAVDSNNKILVVGTANRALSVVRLNDDGTLDSQFGVGGKLAVSNSNVFSYEGFDVTLQTDGTILVVGIVNSYKTIGSFVTRISAGGTLDQSFGSAGSAGGPFYYYDRGLGVATQSDGKILISGYGTPYSSGPSIEGIIGRYNPDGSFDTTFGSDGKVLLPDFAWHDIAVQPDGKIVVAGTSNLDFAITRINASGQKDISFGTLGVVTTAINGTDEAYSMVLQADGKILVVGQSNNDFAAIRYNIDGSLDASFGVGGKVTTDISGPGQAGIDQAYGLALQSDGKIVLAGYSNEDFAVVRYNTDGSVDTTFGKSAASSAGLQLVGSESSETLVGGSGNDTISGAGGTDTVVYSGPLRNFSVRTNADGSHTVRDNVGSEGTDTLTSVERLQFADMGIAFDTTKGSSLYQALQIIHAALGASGVSDTRVIGAGLWLFDHGQSMQQVAQLCVDGRVIGASDNASFVTTVWANVFQTSIDSTNLAYLAGLLDRHTFTQVDLLSAAALLPDNLFKVDLVGLANTGIQYTLVI